MTHALSVAGVVLLGVVVVVGQGVPHSPGSQKAAPGNPGAVFAQDFPARWIDDRDFVHGPSLLDFDLEAYLATTAPHLLRYAEFVSHWSGYYSISPRVLLTLLEMRTGVVTLTSDPRVIADPGAGLVPGVGFEAQVKNILDSLYVDFYAYRAAPATRNLAMNGATFALLNLFRETAAPDRFTATVANDTARRFLDTHSRLFPGVVLGGGALMVQDAPPPDLLQLPWRNGDAWFFNGVHTWTGSDPGVMSSIDFLRSFSVRWGDDTSTHYVAAAHAGTVARFSSCSVRITADNGWATNYYHLSNLTVNSGTRVNANDVIGVYANSPGQALCQGGSSSAPHVHFSLLQNGAFAPLAGTRLSGYIVNPGRFSYDTDRNFMWLQSSETGTRHYVGTALVSRPTVAATPTAPGAPTGVSVSVTGLNVTIAWAAPSTGSAPTSYRLDFRSGGTLVASVPVGAVTSTSLAAPPGTTGTYTVSVTALAGATAGPASAAASFTIGPVGCSTPAAPTGLVGTFSAGAIALRWNAAPGAASYIVRAGSTPGASDLHDANVGAATSIQASGLSTGVRAYVRVIAVNACGQQGPATPDVLVTGASMAAAR